MMVLMVLMAGVAWGQVTPGSYVVLASAQSLTNGSTTTLNVSTNVSASSESIQLMAIIAPQGTTALTKANFTTNLVLTFGYMIGTNVTTDTPFTWTIANDVLAATLAAGNTNPVCVWTNLTSKRGLTGIALKSALPASTNAAGATLTLLVGRSP
jgi:hypothetical protein